MGILDEALGPMERKFNELESQIFKKKRGRPLGVKNKPKKRPMVPKTLERMDELVEKNERSEFKVEVKETLAPEIEKVEEKRIRPHVTREHRKYGGYFTEEVRVRCLDLMRSGATMGKIAQALGVSYKTVFNWKNKSEDFTLEANHARGLADEMVESKLFRRAVGYDAPKEVVQFSKEGETMRADTFQHIPPDVDAAKFWLKNRKPTQWRDHIDTDITLIPRLVVQTHLGDEVLHDAKVIEENTPKLLSQSDQDHQDETSELWEGVPLPEDEIDEKSPGIDDSTKLPGIPGSEDLPSGRGDPTSEEKEPSV